MMRSAAMFVMLSFVPLSLKMSFQLHAGAEVALQTMIFSDFMLTKAPRSMVVSVDGSVIFATDEQPTKA